MRHAEPRTTLVAATVRVDPLAVQTRFAPILIRSHSCVARDGSLLVVAPADSEQTVPISVVVNRASAIRD